MTQPSSKTSRPTVAELAHRLDDSDRRLAALADENRKLAEENRRLALAVERLHGRLDEQREWFKDALDEQMAKLEAQVFHDIRAREKRARDHILPWLEQHSQAIRDLLLGGVAGFRGRPGRPALTEWAPCPSFRRFFSENRLTRA